MGKTFLKWWVIFNLFIAGGIISYSTGVINEIWTADFTYLTSVIGGIFLYVTLLCGRESYRTDKRKSYRSNVDFGYFVSSILMGLGMLGTLIGFSYALLAFNQVDTVDAMKMLKELSGAVSTAIYTTILGLVTSNLVRIQYFMLDHAQNE